ncbi:MAG: hypothetical protein WAM28_04130 [Chlamydiales bacterium]
MVTELFGDLHIHIGIVEKHIKGTIIQMAEGVFRRAMVFQRSIANESLDQFLISILLLMLVEFEFAGFNLPFCAGPPILGFLFALESFADDGIALDADDCPPCEVFSAFKFSFVNRCHESNLISYF